ncbi:MAG TPA: nitroreductase family deazaflavin-dependent oxidoreductase [Thermomicrobiales bacterium]|nr:nitroreductase family deazaflavin-dependent oxidoreductase [Thermomicrobiales bacterium]
MPIPTGVARFNRRVSNRLIGTFAGRAPGMGMVRHVGRRSGRAYETPVNVFARDGGYIIALTYGADTDWVKNVLAAGGCELRTRGRVARLRHPRIVTDAGNRWAPLPVRLVFKVIRSTQHMRLETVGTAGR